MERRQTIMLPETEITKSDSTDFGRSSLTRNSESLAKYGSPLLVNRSKGHLQKSESREFGRSVFARKSELLTRFGSRLLANRSKGYLTKPLSSKIRRMSYRRLSALPDVPTSGVALLEWTKNNMSFMSTSELSVSSSGDDTTTEEFDITSVVSSEKKIARKSEFEMKDQRKDEPISPKKKKLKKSLSKRLSRGSEHEELDNTNLIRGLEDEIMTLFRKKKEEENLHERAARIKSDATFIEATELQLKPKTRKKRKTLKTVEKKPKKKTALELQMIEEQKAAEELARQEELRILHEKLRIKRAQDQEEENMAMEHNILLKRKMKNIDDSHLKNNLKKKRLDEWILYSSCIKYPDITKLDQLTFFVHKLELEFDQMSIQEVTEKIGTNLKLLDDLDEAKSQLLVSQSEEMSKLNWIIGILRDVQWTTLEKFVYRILYEINDNMTIDNLDYATFQHKSDIFTLSLWLRLDWPISLPNPKTPPPSKFTINLSHVDVAVTLPPSFKEPKTALMCYYLLYDHLSDCCSTYCQPNMSDFVITDILETNRCDRLLKNKYEYECYQRTQYISKVLEHQSKQGNEKYLIPFVLYQPSLDENIPVVPVQDLSPTAAEYLDLAEDVLYERMFRSYITYVDQDEVNLREFHIIGAVYRINVLYHPPQRQELVLFHMDIRNVFQTRKLEYVPFQADFPTHIPRSLSTYSGTYAKQFVKGKRHSRRSARRSVKSKLDLAADAEETQLLKEMETAWLEEMDAKKENLISITIRLSEDVIFLEKPMLCMWNEDIHVWEIVNIFDSLHDEKEKKVTFLTTQFGIFGLAVKRYLNFPYSHWDIRPKSETSVAVALLGAKVNIHFTITERNIEITHLGDNDGHSVGLDHLLSKVMTLRILIKTLRKSGLDLFPDYDANCYYKETSEKHWALSYTTYYSMAMMAPVYNFSSSKFNATRHRRSLVLNVREFHHSDNVYLLQPYLLILATPTKCQPLICTENDETFFDAMPESAHPNLFQLLRSMVGTTNRARLKQFSPITVHTLAQFLVQTRLFSFS